MREILFRGRRPFNGEWVEGSLICVDDYVAILENDQDSLHGLDRMRLDKDTDTMDGQITRVERETIGQFTGHLDKNSKKIFEGDIVNVRSSINGLHYLYVVVYWKGGLGYRDYEDLINDSKPFITSCISNFNQNDTEILGNIHDMHTLEIDKYIKKLRALRNGYSKMRYDLNKNFIKTLQED